MRKKNEQKFHRIQCKVTNINMEFTGRTVRQFVDVDSRDESYSFEVDASFRLDPLKPVYIRLEQP